MRSALPPPGSEGQTGRHRPNLSLPSWLAGSIAGRAYGQNRILGEGRLDCRTCREDADSPVAPAGHLLAGTPWGTGGGPSSLSVSWRQLSCQPSSRRPSGTAWWPAGLGGLCARPARGKSGQERWSHPGCAGSCVVGRRDLGPQLERSTQQRGGGAATAACGQPSELRRRIAAGENSVGSLASFTRHASSSGAQDDAGRRVYALRTGMVARPGCPRRRIRPSCDACWRSRSRAKIGRRDRNGT